MLRTAEIKEILKQERISISKRRGQNFLIDQRAQKRIIQAIDVKAAEEIVEIGPGLGALTEDLALQANKVFAVEKDKALVRILQQRLSRYTNLQIIHQDILKFDIKKSTHKKVKIVGNLPYYITTPIIGYLLEQQRKNLKEIFITVQHEVGRRLVAKCDSKDYSSFTIFVQYFSEPKILFSIPKRAFYPQPKVDSVFVHLDILKAPRVKVNNQKQFFKIVRACFNQRRKTILNSLAHRLEKQAKDKIQQILQEENIDFQARPERLSLDDFARIENTFYKRRIKFE